MISAFQAKAFAEHSHDERAAILRIGKQIEARIKDGKMSLSTAKYDWNIIHGIRRYVKAFGYEYVTINDAVPGPNPLLVISWGPESH